MSRMFVAGVALAVSTGFAAAADLSAPYGPPPAMYNPAPAVMGYVGLYGGFASFDSDTVGVFAFDGAANIPFGHLWNLQLEGRGQVLTEDGAGIANLAGFAHVYRRDPNSHALGFYGGYEHFNFADAWVLGVEGQAYFNAVTLYGQLAAVHVESGPFSETGLLARGAIRYFVTPNFKLQGDIQYVGIDSVDTLTLAGTLEYRFDNSPISLFGTVRHTDFDGVGDVTAGLIGVRAYLGGSGTLFDQDRNGATMDTLSAGLLPY